MTVYFTSTIMSRQPESWNHQSMKFCAIRSGSHGVHDLNRGNIYAYFFGCEEFFPFLFVLSISGCEDEIRKTERTFPKINIYVIF